MDLTNLLHGETRYFEHIPKRLAQELHDLSYVRGTPDFVASHIILEAKVIWTARSPFLRS